MRSQARGFGVLAALTLPAIALLLPCARAAFAGPVPYDIVYVRQPRFGDTTNTTWPEVAHPARIDPGADLMLLHPDGSEELLVAGGIGSVTDPFVSFDGQWVYYSYFYDVRPQGYNNQRGLPYEGADIFRIHLQTRQIEQLTFGEFTPNTGAGNFDESNPVDPGNGFDRLGYGILNLGPAPVAGGRVAFTSNRNGFVPPRGLTNPTLQLFVMDEDGGNVTQIAPMNVGSALHPTPLRDGRLLFSSLETQGLRDGRMWGIWSIDPDGRHWEPVVSAFRSGQAFHFMTQLSDDDLVVVDYYNLNNNGFGALYRLPIAPPPGTPRFHSAFPDENPPIQQTVGGGFLYPFRMAFTPWGMFSITPFTHGNDEAAPIGGGGVRVGKFTHPSAAPNGDLLVVWTPGPANDLNRPTTDPRYDAGLYVIPGGDVVNGPDELVPIKNDPAYNEAWPRAVVPYRDVHGVDEPVELPWLPNDGTAHQELPAGTPYGLVGTSSFYKRESFPGFVPSWSDTFDGLDAFNTTENGQSSNWEWQGSDAGKYDDAEIWAVRIVAMEPGTHRSYGPNGGPSGGQLFFSHAMERLRILGEIPLRKRDGGGNPVLDPEGNPDTSFLAKVPADQPFTFQTLDRDGLVLNMAQTWHQVRPGEARYDCGGCHAHSQQPLDFHDTYAARPEYEVADLANTTPLLTKDAQGGPSLRVEPSGVVDVEFYRDVRPLLQRSCVPCHTRNDPDPPGDLVLDDDATYENGLPGDYVRLANDSGARWGVPPLVRVGGNPVWRQSNASRYVRSFQSRRSLLIWKIFGRRLDGWTNADHPTESVPGDAGTLPPGAGINESDLDFTGTIMPPPGSGVPPLSDDEKMTIARWIDLGAPINSGDQGNTAYGWFLDDLRPTLTMSAPRPGENEGPLAEIRVGFADAHSGIAPDSLSITADFPVAGRAPGQELADLAQQVEDGVFAVALSPPIDQLAATEVRAEVYDRQGNVTRIRREFSVAAAADATPTTTALDTVTPAATETNVPTPTATRVPHPTVASTSTSTPQPTRTPSATRRPPTETPTEVPDPVEISVGSVSQAPPGAALAVPVSIAPGSGVESFDLEIAYDAAVVALDGVAKGAAAEDCLIDANGAAPGKIVIAGACPRPLAAGGAIAELRLRVVGRCRARSDLALQACELNDGAIPCAGAGGEVKVRCGLRGKIRYYRESRPVRDVRIQTDGEDPIATDGQGEFELARNGAASAMLIPEKDGDSRGAVSALDAAYVLQAQVGLREFDALQQLACDVTANGVVSSLDAARILQYAVGLRTRLPVAETCERDWLFVPAAAGGGNVRAYPPLVTQEGCQPGAIEVTGPEQAIEGLDFNGLVFGDCTGNWSPAAPAAAGARGEVRRRTRPHSPVRVGRLRPLRSEEGRIRIWLRRDGSFNALEIDLAYDPSQLRPAAVQPSRRTRGAFVTTNAEQPGLLRVALASPEPVRAKGSVLIVELDILDPNVRHYPVRLVRASIDEEPVGN